MQTIRTENSVYELDQQGSKVRRVSGGREPTMRFQPDGDWHEYQSVDIDMPEYGMFIVWPYDPRPDMKAFTITSPVLSIEDSDGSSTI